MTALRPWLTLLTTSLALSIAGCALQPTAPEGVTITPPIYAAERTVLEDSDGQLEVYDPWQAYNRSVYWVNAQADDYLLNPLVAFYRRIAPALVRRGVTNFFENLNDIPTLLNQTLQTKWSGVWDTSRRLLTNSTVGVAGVFDVADRLQIAKHDEDFGQTLGHYGVPKGPYLMLPLFGPSTLRDGIGRGVDLLAMAWVDPVQLQHRQWRRLPYYPLLVADTRANTAFQYFETGSPFEYELVRLLFVTKTDFDLLK